MSLSCVTQKPMLSVCSISFHRNGDSDVFVTKLAPEGTSLMYSTYLGENKFDFGHGITVGDNGYAYVTGYTQSTDFPMVNPYDGTYNGDEVDVFLTKFPEDGGSNAPSIPERPSGQTNGKAGRQYTYTSVTTEPQGDNIYYLFDWGDGNDSGWVGPFNSGEEGSASHNWSKGSYNIIVKAKDVNGDVSGWSEPLSVSMPKNKQASNVWFLHWLERFPRLNQIVNLLMEKWI